MFKFASERPISASREAWGFGLVLGSTYRGDVTSVFPLGSPGPGLIGYWAFGPWSKSFGVAYVPRGARA